MLLHIMLKARSEYFDSFHAFSVCIMWHSPFRNIPIIARLRSRSTLFMYEVFSAAIMSIDLKL